MRGGGREGWREKKTYPGVEGGEIGGHVPEIGSLWSNVFLELQSVQEHGDGGRSRREDEHEINMTNLGWGNAIKKSVSCVRRTREEEGGYGREEQRNVYLA